MFWLWSQVRQLMDLMKNESTLVHNVSVQVPVKKEQPLPPASFQRFLRNGALIPGIVLADHQAEYNNMCVYNLTKISYKMHVDCKRNDFALDESKV